MWKHSQFYPKHMELVIPAPDRLWIFYISLETAGILQMCQNSVIYPKNTEWAIPAFPWRCWECPIHETLPKTRNGQFPHFPGDAGNAPSVKHSQKHGTGNSHTKPPLEPQNQEATTPPTPKPPLPTQTRTYPTQTKPHQIPSRKTRRDRAQTGPTRRHLLVLTLRV